MTWSARYRAKSLAVPSSASRLVASTNGPVGVNTFTFRSNAGGGRLALSPSVSVSVSVSVPVPVPVPVSVPVSALVSSCPASSSWRRAQYRLYSCVSSGRSSVEYAAVSAPGGAAVSTKFASGDVMRMSRRYLCSSRHKL